MNALRRVLLAAYSMLFAAACAGLIALAWNQDQQLDVNPGNFRFVAFITAGDSEKYAFTALLAFLVLFAFLTFLVAVSKGSNGRRETLQLRHADGSTVEVRTDSIEALLRDEIESLPEVRQATPRVRGSGRSVEVDVAATVEPSASISEVTALVGQATVSALRDQVGVTNVRRPRIAIRYDELDARPLGRPKPQAAPTMPPLRPAESEPWPPPPAGVYQRPEPAAPPPGEPWPPPPEGMRLEERPPQAPAAPDPEPLAPGPAAPPPGEWPRGPRWDDPGDEAPGSEPTQRRE